MNILVKRYRVRRNGKKYKAGDIIEDVPTAEAEKLVKESHGSLQLLRFKDTESEVVSPENSQEENSQEENSQEGNGQEEINGLPDTIPTVTHRKGVKK